MAFSVNNIPPWMLWAIAITGLLFAVLRLLPKMGEGYGKLQKSAGDAPPPEGGFGGASLNR
jgi:hypothetical protein